jgi:hypothetical protein
MERGDRAARAHRGKPLVQPVEEICAARYERFLEQESVAVGGQLFAKGPEVAMWAIAELELRLGVRGSQSQQDLTGVNSDSREMVSDAVSRVESDQK